LFCSIKAKAECLGKGYKKGYFCFFCCFQKEKTSSLNILKKKNAQLLTSNATKTASSTAELSPAPKQKHEPFFPRV